MAVEGAPPTNRAAVRAVRLGLFGALLLYAALGVLRVVAVPLFVPSDESAHVDYGIQLTHGTLPEAGTKLQSEFPELGQRATVQYVAIHPPLYYVLSGPLERIGLETGHGRIYLVLTRLGGVAVTGVTILLVAMLASAITRSSPPRVRAQSIVLAAGLTATIPALVASSGTIQNDALSVLFSALTMLLLVDGTRRGLTTKRVLVIGLVCALGMLTRIAFLPIFLLAVGTVVVNALWPGLRWRRPPRSAWMLAAAWTALTTGVVVLLSGWFYALSLYRYGDLAGGSTAYEMAILDRRQLAPGAAEGPIHYLLTPSTWWTQLQQMAGLSTYSLHRPPESFDWWPTALLILLAVGAGATTNRLIRRRAILDTVGRWSVVALLLVGVATAAELASHVVNKGTEDNRYLLAAAPLWAIGIALLTAGVSRWLSLAAAAIVAVGTFGSVYVSVMLDRRFVENLPTLRDTLAAGAAANGFPLTGVLIDLLLAGAAAGFVLMVIGLHRAGADPDNPTIRTVSKRPQATETGASEIRMG